LQGCGARAIVVARDHAGRASMWCLHHGANGSEAPDRCACSRARARRVSVANVELMPARRARGRSQVRGCCRVPLHASPAAGDQRGNRPRARPVCVSARSGVSTSSATRGHIQPANSIMGIAAKALHDPRLARDGAIRPATDAPTSHPDSIRATRDSSTSLPDPLHAEAKFVPGLDITLRSSGRPRPAFARAQPGGACFR